MVVVLSRFPYPLEKGDKLRAYFQLVDLSKVFDIHLICTTDQKVAEKDLAQLKPFCTQIHLFKLKKLHLASALIKAVFGKKPFQVHYFYQKWIHRNILGIIEHIHPEYIYCQLIRTTEYVKDYHNCYKTLDYMDALSKGMERRSENSSGFQKIITKIESKRLYNYERQIFDYFENHTIISEQDRKYIVHPKRDTITIIPNGVNESFFQTLKSNKKYTLVFTGNMSYPPNIEAATYIKNAILPLLRDENPQINCLISGANPTNDLKQLASKNFEVGGWVENMQTSYAQSRIFIAPMMIGTGLQNKLLEAMAMGLPCITTTLANNALKATPEKEILIANNAIEFKMQINRLLDSPSLYTDISENGRQYVHQNYQWEAANQKLIKIIRH